MNIPFTFNQWTGNWTIVSLCTIFLATFIVPPANADIVLTFDQSDLENFDWVDQTYGDRVSGLMDGNGHRYGYSNGFNADFAPNVEIEYVLGGDIIQLYTEGYGDLQNVLYKATHNNTGILTMRLTADPGFEVGIFGFDMATSQSAGGDLPIEEAQIRDAGGNVVWQKGATTIPKLGHVHFNTGSSFSSQLTLDIDVSVAPSLLGIDNLRFAQNRAVPEPGAVIPVCGAALGLFLKRRRKR